MDLRKSRGCQDFPQLTETHTMSGYCQVEREESGAYRVVPLNGESVGGMTQQQAQTFATGWDAAYSDRPFSRSELETAKRDMEAFRPQYDRTKDMVQAISKRIASA